MDAVEARGPIRVFRVEVGHVAFSVDRPHVVRVTHPSLPFPEPPPNASSPRDRVELVQRYEDVAQDGRVKLAALPHALGPAGWFPFMARYPDTRRLTAEQGIVPILTRAVVEGGGGPVSVNDRLEAEGFQALARSVDSRGVDRILFILGADIGGRIGRTLGPPPANAGERVHVGRVYAEHVFTRLFAPPDARRVTELPDGYDLPRLPDAPLPWRTMEDVLAIPDGAELYDATHVPDVELVFGLDDTDSNQHVNSLVYPARFAEAALRRLAAHGVSAPLFARHAELIFRKPCFAGERVRFMLRAFKLGTAWGAVGTLVPASEPNAAPRCAGRVLLAD
jgi:hypothetical protein